MINNTEQSCCGCGACIDICPQKCISLVEATLGATIAHADEAKCVQCGKCERVCPMRNTSLHATAFQKEAYAAYASDASVRRTGSSGGIAPLLAKELYQAGYYIYGAAFDGELQLRHICVNNADDLTRIAKSKYLQSNMYGVYMSVSEHLKNGDYVLFIGTPCQNRAMLNYVPEQYRKNLVLVDFFCHNVPSQHFFDECFAFEDAKNGEKTVGFTFRAKPEKPVSPHYCERVTEKNGRRSVKTGLYFDSVFYAAFQKYIILRESCYQCPFSGEDRASDLTVGDFHEIDAYISGVDRFQGVSRVFVNTPKGKELMGRLREKLWMREMDADALNQDKNGFGQTTPRPAARDGFVGLYNKGGIAALAVGPLNRKKYSVQNIYYHMPQAVRKALMRILGGK